MVNVCEIAMKIVSVCVIDSQEDNKKKKKKEE